MVKKKESLTVKEALCKELPKDAIKQREQRGMVFDYLEGWWAIQNANRIFGEDGWRDRIIPESIQHFKLPDTRSGLPQGCFKMIVEVTAVVDGKEVTHSGVGSCTYAGDVNFEMGMKGAETDALKRALRKFGKQFGNELYKKEEIAESETEQTGTSERTIKEYKMDPNQVVPTCDKCGAEMVLRSGKWGPFWSCSNYKSDKSGCNNIYNVDEVDLDGTITRKAKDIGKPQSEEEVLKPAEEVKDEDKVEPEDIPF